MAIQTMVVGLLALPLGCLVGWACAPHEPAGGPGGGLELRVEPDDVAAGDEVLVTLVNDSAADLGYNLCVAGLDRREGERWIERPERPSEVCTMELRVLAPGSASTYRHTIPASLPAGEYRFHTGVEAPLGGERVQVESHAFRIRPG